MPRVEVTFGGDARGAVSAVRQVLRASQDLKAGVKTAATQSIEAQAKERAALRALAAEYRAVAKQAKHGSDEQVAAARLATEAERQLGAQTRRQTGFLGVFGARSAKSGQELGKLERGAIAGSGAMSHLGRNVAYASGAFIGAQGLIAATKNAISLAEDLQVQETRTGQVFKGSASIVRAWAANSVKGLHLTSGAALDLANNVGTVLHALGVAPGVAGKYATSLTKVAVNLAAVKGADPSDVLNAIDAALRGRGLLLAEYGVKLDNVKLKEEALRLGIVKSTTSTQKITEAEQALAIARARLVNTQSRYASNTTQVAQAQLAVQKAEDGVRRAQAGTIGNLTQAQRAQAAYSIILKDSGFAAQGFAKQSHELKGETALLHAEVGQFEEELGTAFVPELTKAAHGLATWAQKENENGKLVAQVKGVVGDLAQGFKALRAVVKTVDKATGGFKQTLELLLALKLAATLAGWSSALKAFAGAEALGGAASAAGTLNGRLRILRTLTSKPFQFVVAWAIVRKITGSNADLSNNAGGPGDLMPVFQNGKWVDPITGKPVEDQAYWNQKWKAAHGGTKPTAGSSINSTGAPKGGAASTERVLEQANRLGVGSGAIYRWGGGHGGAVKPGAVLDCSGYVYQVFTQAGFKGFPGRSDLQWATHSGPNWTSRQVNPQDAQPGDVVFMHGARKPADPGHVGIVTDGSGFDALVMQYVESGRPADTVKLQDIGDLVGVKRFYLAKSDTKAGGATTPGGGTTKPPPTTKKTKTGTTLVVGKAASKAIALPASVKAALGRAEGTTGLADDIAANQEAVQYLKKRLDSATDKDVKAALEQAIGRYQKAINEARKKLASQAAQATSRKTQVSTIQAAFGTAKTTASQAFALDLLPADQEAKLRTQESELSRLIRKATKDGRITPAELAAIKRSWKAMASNISDAERAVKDQAQKVADRQWSGVTTQITRAIEQQWAITTRDFDRETQRGIQSIQDSASSDIAGMQRSFQKQLDAFDRETQRGLQRLAAPEQTPTEKIIADLERQHQATAEQAQLAADQAAGDTKAVAEDLYQMQLESLQAQADAERKSLEEQATTAQEAYQQQRDDLRQALVDAETVRETARQTQADADAQAYQDQRDAQWTALQNLHDDQMVALNQDLEDWQGWIDNKQKAYADFLTWLSQNPITAGTQLPPSPYGGTTIVPIKTKIQQPGKRIAAAGGGEIPGSYVGVPDTVMARVTPGETVLDRSLTTALKRELLQRGGRGSRGLPPIYVLGTSAREVAIALKRIVDGAPDTPSYRSSRA